MVSCQYLEAEPSPSVAASGFYMVLPIGSSFSGVSSDSDAGFTCTILEIEFSSIAKTQFILGLLVRFITEDSEKIPDLRFAGAVCRPGPIKLHDPYNWSIPVSLNMEHVRIF